MVRDWSSSRNANAIGKLGPLTLCHRTQPHFKLEVDFVLFSTRSSSKTVRYVPVIFGGVWAIDIQQWPDVCKFSGGFCSSEDRFSRKARSPLSRRPFCESKKLHLVLSGSLSRGDVMEVSGGRDRTWLFGLDYCWQLPIVRWFCLMHKIRCG